MAPITTKILHDGKHQSIRLPSDFQFDTDVVTLEKEGASVIVRPVEKTGWDLFFGDESLVVPEDFEVGRDLPPEDRKLF
jgi:virulence-associated protein VagC